MASAVHRCLAIPELVEQIIEACGWYSGPFRLPWHSTLASVARTCTALREPALNCLWREQLLGELVRTLPSHLWSEVDGELVLESQADIDDWECFDYYAPRIIKLRLSVCYYYDTPALVRTFTTLLAYRRGVESFFPNMATLDIYWIADESPPTSISLFFGPKLRRLYLNGRQVVRSFTSDLTYLPRLLPDLRHLTIGFIDSTVLRNLPDILPGLSQLRHLRLQLDNFDHNSTQIGDGLEIISALPHLETFETNCLHTQPSITSPAHAPGSSFRALKRLSFSGCRTVRGCIHFMESYRPTSLEDLALSFHSGSSIEDSPSTAFTRLMQAIRDVVQHSRFKHFRLNVTECSHPGIAISSLRPLFAFRELQLLQVGATTGVRLDDDAIKELAQAFPHLRSLRISGIFPHRRPDIPTPTLLALVHLVQYCPRLESLCMEFDASQVSLEDVRPGRGYCNADINYIGVGRSPRQWTVEDPVTCVELAAFLLDLFPNLKYIGSDNSLVSEEDWGRSWDEVAKVLPVLRRVRQWGREST